MWTRSFLLLFPVCVESEAEEGRSITTLWWKLCHVMFECLQASAPDTANSGWKLFTFVSPLTPKLLVLIAKRQTCDLFFLVLYWRPAWWRWWGRRKRQFWWRRQLRRRQRRRLLLLLAVPHWQLETGFSHVPNPGQTHTCHQAEHLRN